MFAEQEWQQFFFHKKQTLNIVSAQAMEEHAAAREKAMNVGEGDPQSSLWKYQYG